MENKQKALEMAAAMQQKEKSGSLLWCVAEDLKATIQSMNEEEAKVDEESKIYMPHTHGGDPDT